MARDEELDWFATLGDSLRVERVDGVPVVHVGAPGPVRGALCFRVGTADEPLPQRGLTHLIEHLALHGQVGPSDHRNGMTGATITQFVVSGSERQVVAFLNHVCAGLRDLPVERLEAERSILAVEAQGRLNPMDDILMRFRFGAQGVARRTYREFGAEFATAEDVVTWARRWFVRGNAVAYITTDDIPEGLDLRLPQGERQIHVTSPTLLENRPAWFEGADGIALVDAVVPRSTAAVLFTEVLSKSLFRQLRVERGYSYMVGANYEPLDADFARIFVFADAAPEKAGDMVGALAGALSALRDGQLDPADVADAREQIDEASRQAVETPESMLGSAAVGFLLGGEPWQLGDESAERNTVTEDDLAAVARTFWDDAIWQIPSEPEGVTGLNVVGSQRDEPVYGLAYFRAIGSERLVISAEGVSVIAGDESFTVLLSDCVLVMQWGDGGRLIMGGDGTTITIEPTVLLHFGEKEVARFDASVPPGVVVRLPARATDVIPQPPSPQAVAASTPGLGGWAVAAAISTGVFAALLFASALTRTLVIGEIDGNGIPVSASSASSLWAIGALFLGGTVALLQQWVHRLKWTRSRRPQPSVARHP